MVVAVEAQRWRGRASSWHRVGSCPPSFRGPMPAVSRDDPAPILAPSRGARRQGQGRPMIIRAMIRTWCWGAAIAALGCAGGAEAPMPRFATPSPDAPPSASADDLQSLPNGAVNEEPPPGAAPPTSLAPPSNTSNGVGPVSASGPLPASGPVTPAVPHAGALAGHDAGVAAGHDAGVVAGHDAGVAAAHDGAVGATAPVLDGGLGLAHAAATVPARTCGSEAWGGWEGTAACRRGARRRIPGADQRCRSDDDCILLGTSCDPHGVSALAARRYDRWPAPCTPPGAGNCSGPTRAVCDHGCCMPDLFGSMR